MEIQDVGLPAWTLQLPHGMVLKMGSAQGVLIIPGPEDGPHGPDEPTEKRGIPELPLPRKTVGEMQAEEIKGRLGLNAIGEYEPTDLREQE